MKKVWKVVGWLVGIAILVCGTIFVVAWKSPKYYIVKDYHTALPYLPFSQYDGNHPRPYVVETDNVLIFGAEHTRDPKHPEIRRMAAAWRHFQPTVALVEGRLGFLLPRLMDPVKELGEGGKVKELAEKDNLPLYTWDLSKEELAKGLQQKFTAEQIALYQVLLPYFGTMRFGKPSSPADYLQLDRAAYVGLQDSLKTVEDIDRVWRKHFPGMDWREVSDERPLPGFLADIMTVTNDLRNQQLIAAVRELTAKGEKVFVVCGSSHAVCVAPAFK
jgi:hypothetical protein